MIDELFSSVFREHQTLWYFDDFEDNLEWTETDWQVRKGQLDVIRALLDALPYAEDRSKFLLTSRYPFRLEVRNRNLPDALITQSLASMRGADLDKKLRQLDDRYSELYTAYSGGNPRVLDWLDEVVRLHPDLDLDELREELKTKQDEYIHRYLGFLLAESEGRAFTNFLQQSSVFNEPVPPAAFDGLEICTETDRAGFIETGVKLTLMEEVRNPRDDVSSYTVHPLLQDGFWAENNHNRQEELHEKAGRWYEAGLEHGDDPATRRQAMDHLLEANHVKDAAEHARILGNRLKHLALFGEATDCFEQAMRIFEAREDEPNTAFINDYAQLLQDTNRLEESEPLMRRALEERQFIGVVGLNSPAATDLDGDGDLDFMVRHTEFNNTHMWLRNRTIGDVNN
ncbi:MAG: hypothetical protein AAF492_26340, partial [Verrucomicrobiota bacterium]